MGFFVRSHQTGLEGWTIRCLGKISMSLLPGLLAEASAPCSAVGKALALVDCLVASRALFDAGLLVGGHVRLLRRLQLRARQLASSHHFMPLLSLPEPRPLLIPTSVTERF